MVQECKVILRNELVMVVSFDGKEIQLPSDKSTAKTVFVKFEKGNYILVDRLEKRTNKKNKVAKEVELTDDIANDSEVKNETE